MGRASTRRRSTRYWIVAAAAGLAAVLASVALAQTLPPTGYVSSQPNTNPDLRARCGLNVILVLDGSGSAKRAGAEDDVRAATTAFINALNGTGSKLAIIDFAGKAEIQKDFVEVTDATDDGLLSFASGWNAVENGPTNWDDAFLRTLSLLDSSSSSAPTDFIVFVTDGDPTIWNSNHVHGSSASEPFTSGLEGTGQVVHADAQPQGASNAIDHANVVRSAGKHIFVVAVGEGFSSRSRDRIIAISGPDELGAGGSFANGRADFTFVGFNALAAALRALATDLCASSVKVTKEVDADRDGAFDDPAGGFTFTGNVEVDPGTYEWRVPGPTGGTGERSAPVTALDPKALFAWLPSNAQATSRFTFRETDIPASYEFDSVTCSGGRAVDSLPATIEIRATESAECTVRNVRLPGVNLCHATDDPTNPYESVYMYLEGGQLKPADHRNHSGDIIPSFNYPPFPQFPGRNLSESAQIILQSGCMVPEEFRQVRPTVGCVERFGDDKLRAHFGYVNDGSKPQRLSPGTPWNSFSPEPANRGQGADFATGPHPDTVQVEFGTSRTLSWTLGTTTVSASTKASVTRRCEASITVVKELNAPSGGRFNLRIDGEIAGTGGNVGNKGNTGTVAVTASPGGTNHQIDETGAGTTNVATYERSIHCVWTNRPNEKGKEAGHSLSIEVRDGDAVVCTIVNERKVKQVVPIAECVQPLDPANNRYLASFGWDNNNPYPVDIEYGPQNRFVPDLPDDKKQPTDFAAGRHRRVLEARVHWCRNHLEAGWGHGDGHAQHKALRAAPDPDREEGRGRLGQAGQRLQLHRQRADDLVRSGRREHGLASSGELQRHRAARRRVHDHD